MSGFIVGITRMVLDFVYQAPECGVKDTRPIFVKDFHYMYFALMIFLLTGIVCIVVSLLTPAPDPEMVSPFRFALPDFPIHGFIFGFESIQGLFK